MKQRIKLAHLRACLRFASIDDVRVCINSVDVEFVENRIVYRATNGRMLIRLSVPGERVTGSMRRTLPSELIRCVTHTERDDAELEFGDLVGIHLGKGGDCFGDGVSLVAKPYTDFPAHFDKVVGDAPVGMSQGVEWLNHEYVAEILAALGELNLRHAGVQVSMNADALAIRSHPTNDIDVIIVLMGMRGGKA